VHSVGLILPVSTIFSLISGSLSSHVHRMWMEERPPIWRVASHMLNEQSRTTDKAWSSGLGVGRDTNSSLHWKLVVLRNKHLWIRPGLFL